MNGLHLIADLYDCECAADRLLDVGGLEDFCVGACLRHGLTVVGRLFHGFTSASGEAAGVTGTVVLAESHLAVHTWPEQKSVTLDVYVCNFSADNSANAEALFGEMTAHFQPGRQDVRHVLRGRPAG